MHYCIPLSTKNFVLLKLQIFKKVFAVLYVIMVTTQNSDSFYQQEMQYFLVPKKKKCHFYHSALSNKSFEQNGKYRIFLQL